MVICDDRRWRLDALGCRIQCGVHQRHHVRRGIPEPMHVVKRVRRNNRGIHMASQHGLSNVLNWDSPSQKQEVSDPWQSQWYPWVLDMLLVLLLYLHFVAILFDKYSSMVIIYTLLFMPLMALPLSSLFSLAYLMLFSANYAARCLLIQSPPNCGSRNPPTWVARMIFEGTFYGHDQC